MLDADHGPTLEDENVTAFPEGVPIIRIWNKIDRPATSRGGPDARRHPCLPVGGRGQGVDLLRAELLRIAGWQQTVESRTWRASATCWP
jgi:tRNA modification GTPase